MVDKSVLVVAPLDARVARIVERDKLDEPRVRARMAAQIAPERARLNADFIIENDGNLDRLRERTREIYEALR
jgi:dephospho-CoA kinase